MTIFKMSTGRILLLLLGLFAGVCTGHAQIGMPSDRHIDSNAQTPDRAEGDSDARLPEGTTATGGGTPAAILIMDENAPYSAQAVRVDNEEVPLNFLDSKASKRFRVHHLNASPDNWVGIVSHNTIYHKTKFGKSYAFPEFQIEDKMEDGYMLTQLQYNRKQETYGFTFGRSSGIVSQEVRHLQQLDASALNAELAKGFILTAVVHDGQEWHLVLSRGPIYTDHKVIFGQEFPRDAILEKMRRGYNVKLLNYYNGSWIVYLAKYPGSGKQSMKVVQEEAEGFPTDWLRVNWELGRRLEIAWVNMPQYTTTEDNIEWAMQLAKVATDNNREWYEEFIDKNAPSEDAYVAVRQLAAHFIDEGKFNTAADVFEEYKPEFPQLQARFDRVISTLRTPQPEVKVENLGNEINSTKSEYEAIPSADGKRLYFTGNKRRDGYGGEDVYVIERRGDGWGGAQPMGEDVNTATHNESANSISADGNILYLFGNYDDSFGSGDNYYANKTSTGWGRIRHLPEPVNSPYFDSECMLTADGQWLLFVSDRPGARGGTSFKGQLNLGSYLGNTDIYVVRRYPDGRFGEPINLGGTVNSPYAERTPFLHPDGKTLYFASSGHSSLGDLDVFMVRRTNPNSWTEWSTPVNLGRAINGIDTDWGYRIATDGQTAYCARTSDDGLGGDDIYSVNLPEAVRPEAVATIRGVVTDADGNPLEAAIKWEDLVADEEIGELHTDPRTGEYFIVLPLGADYGYFAEKETYYPISNALDLTRRSTSFDTTINITLRTFDELRESGEAMRLNNIFFSTASYQLRNASHLELDRLATILKDNPGLRIEIAGHTDGRGGRSNNQVLSEQRANAVLNYLAEKGVARRRMRAVGFGPDKPVATNETAEGRQQNRRVEFRILK